MTKLHPKEICEYLASRADADYASVKFKGCLFSAANSELISTFLYQESIKHKISAMKAPLEQEFRSAVGISELKYLFLYKQAYMDAGRLEILTHEFLRRNFSFLTLDLQGDDLAVETGDGGRGFTVRLRLPKQAADYIRGSRAFNDFVKDLHENNFAQFNFVFIGTAGGAEKGELTLRDIEKFAEEKLFAAAAGSRVDKSLKISDREYFLGAPIKERPIKIEFLRVSPNEQVIAGTISFFTQREFKKKRTYENENGGEVTVEKPTPYWTFVLDDGGRKQSCVYFLSGRSDDAVKKNTEKMQTLADGKTICVIGTNSERNGRVNFVVRGISLCKIGAECAAEV